MLSSMKSRFAGKTFLKTLFFFLLVTQICFAQWFYQSRVPEQNNTLESVKFISTEVGWAVGVGGTILRTIDGGETWTSQTSGTTNQLFDIFFI